MADDRHVVARGPAERTAVPDLLLDVGHDGTLRHGAQGQDVADGQGGVLSGVDELARVHALVGNERLGDLLERVRVPELHLGQGSTPAGIVDDLLHQPADVAMSLSVVEGAELGGSLSQVRVSLWGSN